MKAADAKPGDVYRQTQNPRPGMYYTPTTKPASHFVSKLESKQRHSREEYILNRLSAGWLAFWRVTRVSDGRKITTTRELCAVPPDHTFRYCKNPPAPVRR